MSKKYYCPDCKEELEEMNECGSQSFFCNKCKTLKSRSKILEEKDLNKEEK